MESISTTSGTWRLEPMFERKKKPSFAEKTRFPYKKLAAKRKNIVCRQAPSS